MLHFLFLAFFLAFHISSSATEVEIDYAKEIVENIIQDFMKQKEIPGVAVALYDGKKGSLLSFGYADDLSQQSITPETIFEIASITKVFTSTALAIEVLRNKMRLSDPLVKYLPAIKNRTRGIGKVTLAQLATHTSSLPRVPPPLAPHRGQKYNVPLLMQFLEQWEPSHPIGSRSVYSNLGFGLLGYAISNVEKKSYADTIRLLITIPLNMKSTFIMVPHHFQDLYAHGYNRNGGLAQRYPLNAWPGGGALRSTSDDMLKFLLANMGIEGPPEMLQAMQIAQKGIFKVNNHLTLGLGWQRFTKDGLLYIDKNGGVEGFSSYIGWIPNQKIGIVLLANKGKTQITQLGRHILSSLQKKLNDFDELNYLLDK